MVTLRQIETLLETYTLEEVLEYNDYSEAETLHLLVTEENFQIPYPVPVDYDTSEE